MRQNSIADWVVESALVDGVVFGTPDSDVPAPVCAVASVRGVRGYGKGLTQSTALVSAVGEALEQYAARQVPRESLIFAPFDEVKARAFDPQWLCLYDWEQYQRPAFPCRPFDAARPMLWASGHWLDSQEPVLLPAAAVYLNAELEEQEALCQMTSNGLAAGADLADAAGRAVLELYERDAFLRSWLTRQPGALLPPDGLDAEYRRLLESVQLRGARTAIFLLSTGPCVALCVARGDGSEWPGITSGLGAAWDVPGAAQKAVLEHGQTGPYLARIWRERERLIPAAPEDIRTLQDHALYYCDPAHAKEFDFFRAPVPEPPPAPTDVRIAIVDLTPPDLMDSPFRVVRAVARGLQPIHYGAGFERCLAPQITALLAGKPPNSAPIPIC